MSFIQSEFFFFILIFLPLYYSIAVRLKLQNFLVFIASIFFYAWWSKQLTLLILGMSLVGYGAAILIEIWPKFKRIFLFCAVILLLSILAYFKYANFFIDSFFRLLNLIGITGSSFSLNIILPLGISFHTFQVLAYIIDVYKKEVPAERDFVKFNAFALFFPQLVAGPIERANHLLPQFSKVRQIDFKMISSAFHVIVLGYFFKIFVADSAAEIANIAFSETQASGWWTILGTLAFGLQIYGDFLGYSLIAKGIALLLGFDLSWNFIHPYWSKSIRDFWSAWHITLSQWLRDYLYIPLGGNRGSRFSASKNTLITMSLGGLWHGASWNFIAWGLFHGIALAVYHGIVQFTPKRNFNKYFSWFLTMLVVYLGWFLFRARNWTEIKAMLTALGNLEWYPAHYTAVISLCFLYAVLFSYEYAERKTGNRYAIFQSQWMNAFFYGLMLFIIFIFGSKKTMSFIYFQF